ncbi:3-methyladenine DNA glycosylase [Helicobacter sp. 23-1048]
MIECIDILHQLKKLNLLAHSPKWWWANAGSFEVAIGAILTQNSKWENVLKSLQSLRNAGIIPHINGECMVDFTQDSEIERENYTMIENIANCEVSVLASHIVGLQNQKAVRLQNLAQNLLQTFCNFKDIKENLSRDWLLAQKGFGFESADCVLNYMCGREIMVVDKYTQKFLSGLGIEFEDYQNLQAFFMSGLEGELGRVSELYGEDFENLGLGFVYARFHGKIVEFGKAKLPYSALKK